MGVIVKGMKMPEHCYMCNLAHRAFDGNETRLACYALKQWCIEDDGRRDDCPLVELHEKHGRLIDADALIEELNDCHLPGAPYVDAGISIAIGKVCDAPTIIEAEGDEE